METLQDIVKRQHESYLRYKALPYIRRNVQLQDTSLIQVVIGPRRAGKSFFCIHSVPRAIYLNFDDEGLLKYPIDEILQVAKIIFAQSEYIILDEVQNIARWELVVNRLHRQGVRLIITGSNAHLLSGELATHLTGRHLPLYLLPLSYAEVQSYKPISVHEYAQCGGLPENVLYPGQMLTYTVVLVNSILFKDIVQRYSLRKSSEMQALLLFLLSNSGKVYTDNKLAKNSGVQSPSSVRKYIQFLEGSFLLFSLHGFSFKTKLSQMKKAYAWDTSYIHAFSSSMSADHGRTLETMVAIQLKHEELVGKHRLYFYKNPFDLETDFVLVKDQKVVQLLQVTADPTKERELRGLFAASKDTGCSHLVILNPLVSEKKNVSWFGKEYVVEYVRIGDWLLSRG